MFVNLCQLFICAFKNFSLFSYELKCVDVDSVMSIWLFRSRSKEQIGQLVSERQTVFSVHLLMGLI